MDIAPDVRSHHDRCSHCGSLVEDEINPLQLYRNNENKYPKASPDPIISK
jgi:hypothetical protein